MRKRRDVEKVRYWRGIIREAARSGMSTRAFCRQRKLKEAQFYWWQRRLKESRQPPRMGKRGTAKLASFALVREEPGASDASIELVLGDGRRLRIAKGVDEQTLRAVLAAVGPAGC